MFRFRPFEKKKDHNFGMQRLFSHSHFHNEFTLIAYLALYNGYYSFLSHSYYVSGFVGLQVTVMPLCEKNCHMYLIGGKTRRNKK